MASMTSGRGNLPSLVAAPLPGFLLDDEEDALAAPLLEAIFQSRIGGRTVAAILNGE
jgi:hypothetical protein